jgi:ketosteroid isomerase-like protein
MREAIYGALVLGLAVSAMGCASDPPPAPAAPPAPVAAAEPAPVAAAPAEAPKPSLADLEMQSGKTIMEGYNAHDAAKIASAYTPDAVIKSAGMPDVVGKDAIQAHEQKLFDGISNLKLAATHVYTKNDVLVVEWAINGTQSGEFMGQKATNKPIGFTGATVNWYTPEGLIKEAHVYNDDAVILAQMGVSKQKARPIPALAEKADMTAAKGTPDEDKNVDVVKAMYTAFGAKKDADFLALSTDDVTWDDSMMPTQSKGKAEAKSGFKMLTTAFPDIAMTATNAWGIGDYAIVEGTLTGTQKGALGKIAATRKPVTLHYIDIVQIKDGKMVHGTQYADSMEMMGQLGLLPKAKMGADMKAAPTAKASMTKAAPKK